MSQTQVTTNQRVVLASRPTGAPTADNFRLETAPIPALSSGQFLIENEYLSLDPYMRGRMNDAESYAPPVAIDEVMVGGTVGRVRQSQHDQFAEGDLVVAFAGWQKFCISDGENVIKLDPNMPSPSHALGVLGMPGFTAYMGLLDIGQPKAGETVVVAAATGAVGSMVGQIAKLKGCKVIGIAGGREKCNYAFNELGFDACIDHRADDFATQLQQCCEQGIDVYFENVGGQVFEAVLPLLNVKARVPVCGLISQYNATELPSGPDRTTLLMGTLLVKRIKMQGFIIFDDYADRYPEFLQNMSQWLSEGKIKYREHLIQGLDNAPDAFRGLLQGENFGKLVVKI